MGASTKQPNKRKLVESGNSHEEAGPHGKPASRSGEGSEQPPISEGYAVPVLVHGVDHAISEILHKEVAMLYAVSRMGRLPDEDLKRLEQVTKILKSHGAKSKDEAPASAIELSDEDLLDAAI